MELETAVQTVYHADSEDAMEQLGAALAKRITGGCVLFLTGDLGAGKTTLVRGLLRALGYEAVVVSPTFTLLETYHAGGLEFVHIDLYRIDDPTELEALAIRDYLREQSVLLVEWADRARDRLPSPDCEVHIVIEEDDRRTVRLESQSATGGRLCSV